MCLGGTTATTVCQHERSGTGTPTWSVGLPCCEQQLFHQLCVCLLCRSRSPLNLLQESYPDPWQHITCCVLCSRTSGSELIRTAIAAFFAALPTPTAVLAAEGARSSRKQLLLCRQCA